MSHFRLSLFGFLVLVKLFDLELLTLALVEKGGCLWHFLEDLLLLKS